MMYCLSVNLFDYRSGIIRSAGPLLCSLSLFSSCISILSFVVDPGSTSIFKTLSYTLLLLTTHNTPTQQP